MNYFIKRILLLFIFVLTSEMLFSQNIEILTDEWPPFQIVDSESGLSGFGFELVESILNKMNISYTIKVVPYTRLHYKLRDGDSDAAFLVTETQERKQYLLYSKEPVYSLKHVYFTRNEEEFKKFQNSYNDLIGYRLGLTRDYQYPVDFIDFLKKNNITHEYVVNDEQNFKKLYSGRVDIVVADINNGREIIRKNNYNDQIISLKEYTLAEYNLYFVWRKIKEYHSLAAEFSEKLKQLKETEEYTKLIKKYFS